jgi:hypothetical protein
MRFRKFSRITVLGGLLVAVGLGQVSAQQKEPQKTPTPAMSQEQIEKAHERIFSTQQDKAKEASRLTAEAAKSLPGKSTAAAIPHRNFVDDQIFGRIEKNRIPHSPLSTDEEFLRRAYLDATGLLPPVDKVREFVADKDPQKRDKLIDSLIGTEEFADQWAWFWGDLFRTREPQFHYFTRQWLKVDRPYNEVFADIVTSNAKSHIMIPALGFYRGASYNATRAPSPTDADNYYLFNRLDFIDEVTVDVGRIFLGINMDCFSCHDGEGHVDSINLFLASKTRKDFHQQAAFFGNMRRIAGYSDRVLNVSDGNSIFDDQGPGYRTGNDAPFHTQADNRFPRNGQTYEPSFILTGEKPQPGENPRKALARIVPNHIQFSRATANLIWSKLMVVGFVEPYDAFDLLRIDPKNPPPKGWTIQPTNPELLNALAADFKAHNYSIHHLIKTIMKSNAYQLSTQFDGEWKDDYTPYYARRFVRVLTGPEAADVIAQATDRPYRLQMVGQTVSTIKQLAGPNQVGGRRATADGPAEGLAITALMQAFFQSTRETPAYSGNKTSPVQAMLMMASPVVNNRVKGDASTRVGKLLTSGKSDDDVVQELFLSSLSRLPTADEMKAAKDLMAPDRKKGAENVEWALLNSAEFLLNH